MLEHFFISLLHLYTLLIEICFLIFWYKHRSSNLKKSPFPQNFGKIGSSSKGLQKCLLPEFFISGDGTRSLAPLPLLAYSSSRHLAGMEARCSKCRTPMASMLLITWVQLLEVCNENWEFRTRKTRNWNREVFEQHSISFQRRFHSRFYGLITKLLAE